MIQSNTSGKGIAFRQELRQAVEEMVWKKDPENALLIHNKAIQFYQDKEGTSNKAEYVYHRLKRGDDPDFLSKEEYEEIADDLGKSLEELPLTARVHIANLQGSELSADELKKAALEEWEKYYVQIIKDRLKSDFNILESTTEELKLRKERSFCSPLHYWEARLHQRLNNISLSNKIIERAVKETDSIEDLSKSELLIRLKILQIENLEYQFKFESAWERLQQISAEMLVDLDSFLSFQIEVLHTRLTSRLNMRREKLPEFRNLSLDFEKNDTYKSYESYYHVELYNEDDIDKAKDTFTFPFNTLHEKDYLSSFKKFKGNFRDFTLLEDFAGQFLGSSLSGLAEPGDYELVVRDVFNRTNKNILERIRQPDVPFDRRTLIRTLAELYPSIDASRRVLSYLNIYAENISFAQSSLNNWFNILNELEKRNRVVDLLQVIQEEYPQIEIISQYLTQEEQKLGTSAISQKIIKKLAGIYPTRESTEILTKFSKVYKDSIPFEQTPLKNWQNITRYLWDDGKLNHLFQKIVEHTLDKELVQFIKDDPTISVLSDASNLVEEELDFDRNQLEKLIINGKLKEALEKVNLIAKQLDTDIANQIILLQSRLNQIQTDFADGLISYDQYNRSKNQIVNALLRLIDQIEEEGEIKKLAATAKDIKPIKGINVPQKETFDRIIGNNDKIAPMDWVYKAIESSKFVCKIEIENGTKGTGFLLEGGYLLTTFHLLQSPDKSQIKNARVIFNEQRDLKAIYYSLDPDDTFLFSPVMELDYAFIKIKDDPESPLSKWGFAKIEPNKVPIINDLVNIIQHPEGGEKKIAMPDSVISIWEEKNYLYYQADTRPGSSGAPVFNQVWKVVAMHQAGKSINDGGMVINAVGDVMGAKRGILIGAIIADIRAKGGKI